VVAATASGKAVFYYPAAFQVGLRISTNLASRRKKVVFFVWWWAGSRIGTNNPFVLYSLKFARTAFYCFSIIVDKINSYWGAMVEDDSR